MKVAVKRPVPRRLTLMVALAAVVAIAAGSLTYIVGRQRGSGLLRQSGIPASVSTYTANLMGLSPLPARPAPGFTLTDQSGQKMPLSAFHGKVVVLAFMDPRCTDLCPIVAQEFDQAYRDLGSAAKEVVFLAVNVNQQYRSIGTVETFTKEERLNALPWHFFTGSSTALHAVWKKYNINVAVSSTGDIIHTSAVYFIGMNGRERYIASPQNESLTKPRAAYGISNATGYVAPGHMTDWGSGIATIARTMVK